METVYWLDFEYECEAYDDHIVIRCLDGREIWEHNKHFIPDEWDEEKYYKILERKGEAAVDKWIDSLDLTYHTFWCKDYKILTLDEDESLLTIYN